MFVTDKRVQWLKDEFGTPLFVYSEQRLLQAAEQAMRVSTPFGLTVRYAMKANPSRAILQKFDACGLQIDASSVFEAERAVLAGIDPSRILLTTQELKLGQFECLLARGMKINASSLWQLELLARLESYNDQFSGLHIGLRINPGIGSGHHVKTTVGGKYGGFGIWDVRSAASVCRQTGLTIERIHFHIGSGSDSEKVAEATGVALEMIRQWFPTVTTLNVGGGFFVDRTKDIPALDLTETLTGVTNRLSAHAALHRQELRLEIEPGTYLVANAGVLLATALDVKKTRSTNFLLLDAGLTEIMRPSLYGARHPIRVVRLTVPDNDFSEQYRIIGHCCESGDVLTVRRTDTFEPSQMMLDRVMPGDLVLVGGAGAYCSSMSAKNYNSFPEASEVMLLETGHVRLIRRRQTLQQIVENEL